MSIPSLDITTRLANEVRTAVETVTDRDAAQSNTAAEQSVCRNRERRRQRHRTPRVLELDPETVADTPLEGTITVLSAETGSNLLAEFERAVVGGDTDLALDVRDRLAAEFDSETTTDSEPPVITDIVYHDRTIVTTTIGSDRYDAAMARYDGGSLDRSAFEVREHIVEGDDEATNFEWDYCVVVAPPTADRAERDAADAAPEETDTAAVLAGPAGASAAALAFAAGVLIGAAAAGTGSADPAVNQFADQLIDNADADADAGASVQELLDTRDTVTA